MYFPFPSLSAGVLKASIAMTILSPPNFLTASLTKLGSFTAAVLILILSAPADN